MLCPFCREKDTSVVDSRPTEDGTAIRRRRLCGCDRKERFTTFERIQHRELMVIKKSGRKSSFDRDKLAKSIYIALKKRPLDTETVEKFISKISRSVEESRLQVIHNVQLLRFTWVLQLYMWRGR